ncbi:uncharacterized protein F5891DRAFT_1192388 [Suillus fuscotomentosus]|uniref:Uncharacterized protein n=1 Tax=Suillus fuscotomentosus TaxID=1912939 RepID=A0AAD4DZS1_9AGAM|nr:uncharacterized protein F5891DRAFT_1192388 [Suillus fuscotomentosus]KAG1896977.1 hypothetical protein F5891DRAFT_1192388 [Suillus fuscotomentosus]
MAKPRLYNTPEEKLEAACTYRRAYNARQRNKLLAPETKTTKAKRDSAPSMPVGRPCIHDTPDKKREARRRYRQVYYECHRDELRAKKQEKSRLKCWTTQCSDIDARLQAVTGSSSTANFVEGLCKYFVSHPNNPDSLDVMQTTIGILENLHQHAQSVVDNVIEKRGIGCDLSRTQDSVFRVCRVLTAVDDVLTHAIVGVGHLIEVHGQRGLKHQIAQDNMTVAIP